MKYLLLILLVLILSSLAYKYIFAGDEPEALIIVLERQANPFKVAKDSGDIAWQRAKEYLKDNERLISGGDLQEDDSTLYIPYYNRYKKGVSIKIERHNSTDSVTFKANCWYSKNENEKMAKEIAMFMQKHVSKYDFE